jgi:hypothetical protein
MSSFGDKILVSGPYEAKHGGCPYSSLKEYRGDRTDGEFILLVVYLLFEVIRRLDA